jgi:hypothetical protein
MAELAEDITLSTLLDAAASEFEAWMEICCIANDAD